MKKEHKKLTLKDGQVERLCEALNVDIDLDSKFLSEDIAYHASELRKSDTSRYESTQHLRRLLDDEREKLDRYTDILGKLSDRLGVRKFSDIEDAVARMQ